jgi:hypothetical protein
MAYANTYVVNEITNTFIKVRKDTTDKKVQFKETRRPKRFMRVPGYQNVTADGAITIKDGVVTSTKAGVCAMTLAAPTPGDDDGKILKIYSATAQAHTVTAAGGFNAGGTASDVATFGGAIGDGLTVVAWLGAWYVLASTNVTIA